MAVRTSPVPLSADRVPPLTVTSARSNELAGSSLKVKVMVAVSPALSMVASAESAAVGALVSTASVSVEDGAPMLPAASM